VNNVIYWMGHDKFFIYNGRADSLPTTLRAEVFENINYSQAEQFFATTNERFNEIWWFYCSSGSSTIDRYVVYNYLENIWHYGTCSRSLTVPFDTDFVRDSWSDSPLRAYPQAAGEDGYLYNHEIGTDANGESLPAYLSSADFDIDDGNSFSLIRRIIPDVSFTGSTYGAQIPALNMTILPRDFPGDPYDQFNAANQNLTRTAISLVVNQFTEQVFVRARARQMAISISSNASGTAWQLGAPRVDIRQDGTRGYNNTFSSATYWGSQTTNGADTMTALVDPPFVYAVSSATTDGADIMMSSLIGVGVAYTPVALYDAGLGSSYSGSGTTWTDISGNSRNATLVAPSYSGGAFNFSSVNDGTGSGSYAVLPASIADVLTNSTGTIATGVSGGFTINIWFKVTDPYTFVLKGNPLYLPNPYNPGNPGFHASLISNFAPSGAIVGSYVGAPINIGSVWPQDPYISGYDLNPDFGGGVYAPTPQIGNATIPAELNGYPNKKIARGFAPKANRWYNVAYVYNGAGAGDSGALQLYVDGVFVGSGPIPSSTLLNWSLYGGYARTVNVGANQYAGSPVGGDSLLTKYMDGAIAVIGVYKPWLSATQISALYNAYTPRFTNSTYVPVSPAMVTGAIASYDSDVSKYGEIGTYQANTTLPSYPNTNTSNLLFPLNSGDFASIKNIFDQSGNNETLYSSNGDAQRFNVSTIIDPTYPDTFYNSYNFGGRGTYYIGSNSSAFFGRYLPNTPVTPLYSLLTNSSGASFSVNIWVYHTWLGQTSYFQIITPITNGTTGSLFGIGNITTTPGRVYAYMNGASGTSSTTFFTPSLNKWYQYTLTYNAITNALKFYVYSTDGVYAGLYDSTTYAVGAHAIRASNPGILIGIRADTPTGAGDAGTMFRGNFANAQIYSSELTAAQVLQNYNHFLPRFT